MRNGFVAAMMCGVVLLTSPAGSDGLIGGPNLVANAGFESALAAAPACSTPVVTGNWRAVSCAATQLAERVASPVHGGGFSGHVRTLARNGGQAYFYQDLPGFGFNDGFELSAWLKPVAGPQQISMLFGWDRASGATVGSAAIGVSETRIDYGAWGVFHTAPPISYGEWHHLKLVGDVTTGMQQLFIDGVPQTPVPMGTPRIALSATLLLGQGTGVNTPASEFFFDDASVTRLVAPPAAVTQCVDDLAAARAAILARDQTIDRLTGELSAANARLTNLENRLAGAVSDADLQILIAQLTADLRTEFGNPAFVIPGNTALAQLRNVVAAVMNLNHGRKQGVYSGLSGR
jgi:hypothetical protein